MRKFLPLVLCFLPWNASGLPQPQVSVTQLPIVPEPQPLYELSTGTVFEADGDLYMKVERLYDIDGTMSRPPFSHTYWPKQFSSPFDWYPSGVSYYDPPLKWTIGLGVGTPLVMALADLPSDTWIVNLRTARLVKEDPLKIVQPVVGLRIIVKVGPDRRD